MIDKLIKAVSALFGFTCAPKSPASWERVAIDRDYRPRLEAEWARVQSEEIFKGANDE